MSSSSSPDAALLSETVTFPISGHVSPNRLLKAPMEELMASTSSSTPPTNANTQRGSKHAHLPNADHLRLYKQWARSGWGVIVTGNVAVDPRHLGTPFDNAFPQLLPGARAAIEDALKSSKPLQSSDASKLGAKLYAQHEAVLASFQEYAKAVRGDGDLNSKNSKQRGPPLAIVQLVHAGRQSMRGAGRSPFASPWAPSNVPMRPSASPHNKSGSSASASVGALAGRALDWFMWGTPHAMTLDEIREMKAMFLAGALVCKWAGFDGIELHGSHGYMLAAFLSPKTNKRTDGYGGDAKGRARLLLELATEIRQLVGKDFSIGVKLNSADYVAGGLTEDDALQNVKWLAETDCMDFIEVSGGNYENPGFMGESFDAEGELKKLESDTSVSQDASANKEHNAAPAPASANVGSVNKARASGKTKQREAFFQGFAKRSRDVLSHFENPPVLCITGGLKTRGGMASVVRDAQADMAGIGRYSCVYPNLPLIVCDESVSDDSPNASPEKYVVPSSSYASLVPLQIVGAGWATAWHSGQLHFVAKSGKADPKAGLLSTIRLLFLPDAMTLLTTVGVLGMLVVGVLATAWQTLQRAS